MITTRRVSEGFADIQHETQKLNASLTFRVVIIENAQLQNALPSDIRLSESVSCSGQMPFQGLAAEFADC